MVEESFDQLIQEALAQDFSGWDFSWTHGRWHEEEPSWNYEQIVAQNIASITSLLDMGTGGWRIFGIAQQFAKIDICHRKLSAQYSGCPGSSRTFRCARNSL